MQIEPVCVPARALLERGLEDVPRQRLDQPGPLRDGHELARPDEPALRVVPADERLDADDAAGLELGLRLEVDDELAASRSPSQLAGEREARSVVRVLLDVVGRGSGMRILRDVHRDVGVLEERVDVLAVLRVDRDADARPDLEREPADRERGLQRLVDARGEEHGVLAGRRRNEDPELVAPEARERLARAEDALQPRAQLPEEQVARLVPQRVVDLAEAIDVEEQDRRRRCSRCAPASACWMRSRKSTRFGSPVSSS